MNELQIVKWAAGAPLLLEEAPIDDDLLLRLIRRHRLEMRFWDRARRTKLPWCLRRIFLKVSPICNRIRENVQQSIALTNEFVSAVGDSDNPIITIKGITTYALTGRDANQKYSNDLDILSLDIPFLVDAMAPHGFEIRRGQWASHEYGAMKRSVDKSTVEPHRFFPVYSYPDSLPEDLVPEHNPGRWLQRTSNRRQFNIGYEELLANSQRGVAPGTKHLTFPNPSMAALILCAHEFRDFLQRPCRESTIHLLALADIVELVQHPEFEEATFIRLVKQYRGHDSVQLVRQLCIGLLETDPFAFLPQVPELPDVLSFPQLLNYKGGWVLLNEKPDDVLMRLSTASVIERLGVNQIFANRSPDTPNVPDSNPVSRLVIQLLENADSATTDMPFEITSWIDGNLKVEVTLQDSLEIGFNHQIKLYSDKGVNEFHDVHIVLPEEDTDPSSPQLRQIERPNVYAYWKNGKCAVRFSLPEPPGEEKDYLTEPLAVLLLVTKWRWNLEEIFEAASPVIVVPLQIVPCTT